MSDSENRQLGRDSLFVLAELRIDGVEGEQRIRVRNLSAGGLMADGAERIQRGQMVWVNLRNLGWTEGAVAWVQDSRCGIAFREEIDPRIARAPVADSANTPRFVRPPFNQNEFGDLRKI
jgi:hypothetical protein